MTRAILKLFNGFSVKSGMRSASLGMFLLLFAGCASRPLPPAQPTLLYITLEKESEGEHWRATWHLERPTRELRFERRGAGFRAAVFEVLTPGFGMERDGDLEVLRTNGEPAQTITVRFPEFSRKLEKEYEFFQKFSDGSVAIYTGHLVARPHYDDDPAECSGCFIRTFRFVGPPATPIIVDGRVASSPFQWRDEKLQGSYIYFGSIEPVESDEMISIIDPALPRWLEEETKRALPQLFAIYTERFGVDLRERPTILFNYIDNKGSGYSSGGGTLPGQIQLTVDGAAWEERSQEAFLLLFHFLAHEAVHLWNGQLINYPATEDSWMHEGSADALAQRTLRELGLIDEAAFLDYQSAALNECRKRLGGVPLRAAAKHGQFSLYYSCGNAIALLTESVMDEGDLFSFWMRLIARTIDSGEYDAEDYFAVWSDAGAEVNDVEMLRRFIEQSAGPDDLVSMLTAHGVAVRGNTSPPQTYGQSVARDSLLRILGEHCRGGYGFNTDRAGFILDKSNVCGPIPAGGIVTAIGGYDVLREGERTRDALHENCGSDEPVLLAVTVDGSGTTVEAPCTREVTARPTYLEIVSRRE